ncbi:hypothetical protein H0H87_002033, partial [Tephrocybe sp. NHM501043]
IKAILFRARSSARSSPSLSSCPTQERIMLRPLLDQPHLLRRLTQRLRFHNNPVSLSPFRQLVLWQKPMKLKTCSIGPSNQIWNRMPN